MKRYILLPCLILCGICGADLLAGPAPKVAKTVPAAGATDVDPALTQIVVTFDIPVKMNTWSLVYVDGAELPEMDGDEAITFRDNRTCVIKVKLKPNTAYGIGLNSKTRKGFQAAEDQTPAIPYVLTFKTGSGKGAAPKPPSQPAGPRVVKTAPDNGAAGLEPGTFDLTIVFSEPMQPGKASIMTPPEGPRLKLIGKPTWKDDRTFVVPVLLARATTYRLGINTGQKKRFVTAANGMPVAPYELTFSTQGAKAPAKVDQPATAPGLGGMGGNLPMPAPGPKPATPPGPIQLRHNYQKGDSGRVMSQTAVDLKLEISNGKTLPMSFKIGMNGIEEVLAVEEGKPVEAKKLISEFIRIATNPETGQPEADPQLPGGVAVKVNRRSDPVQVEVVSGQPSQTLMALLAEDTFLDLLPRKPIKVGDTYQPVPETLADMKSAFDNAGTGKIDVTVTCRRIGPQTIEDARNKMLREKGGGQPVTYVFNVAEMALDVTQDGTMDQGIPFSLKGTGKLVFAIDAGIVLNLEFAGQITVKPVQTQDDAGQSITVTGGGPFTSTYSFQPINWTRGVERRGAAAGEPSAPGETIGLDTPLGSIGVQLERLKAGDVEGLRACFTDRLKGRITADAVKAVQPQAQQMTLDQLVASISQEPGAGDKPSTATIKMPNGRTLTTLILTNGQWLADTIWFQ